MKLRFSRSSLNLIIFTCIILIGWASIDANTDKRHTESSREDELIALPALDKLQQQTWSSREGIRVIWQTRLDTDFLIRIRGQIPEQNSNDMVNNSLDSSVISWQQGYWQWDINIGEDFELGLAKLNQQIKDFPSALKGQPATILLQGPWSTDIARLSSARLIKSLELKPLTSLIAKSNNSIETHICPWQPVSAQYWLQDQLTNPHASRANIDTKQWWISEWPELAPINQQSLQVWKQTFAQQWQLNWQNPATQFDILADLAYYRLPQNYLLEGYWGINTLDVKQLENYLAKCLMSEQIEQLGSIPDGKKEKQQ